MNAMAAYERKSTIRIGGMLIGYYVICKRKAWLSMRGLWMEQESDTVAIGRLIDRTSYDRKKKDVMIESNAPDGTSLVAKIDWTELREGVLHETKKSRAVEDAHRWQVRFYLWLLKLSGVTRSDGRPFQGVINYPRLKRVETVDLREEDERVLSDMVTELGALSRQKRPPARIEHRRFCRKCAFEELCYG